MNKFFLFIVYLFSGFIEEGLYEIDEGSWISWEWNQGNEFAFT